MQKAVTGGFQGSAKLEQSDQAYNDRADQVMVDVRSWHEADIPPALTNVRYRGQSGRVNSPENDDASLLDPAA